VETSKSVWRISSDLFPIPSFPQNGRLSRNSREFLIARHANGSRQRSSRRETLIRLRFYLAFLGYQLEELEVLEQTVRDAAQLFAFEVASLSDIADMAGYEGNGKSQLDTLIRVFLGTRRVSAQKLLQLGSFVDLYGAKLVEKIDSEVRTLDPPNFAPRSAQIQERPSSSPATRPSSRDDTEKKSIAIKTIAGLIEVMLPLAEYVLSDSFTAEQRSQVRELAASGGGVSRLSNLLTQLSNEAARNVLTKQQ